MELSTKNAEEHMEFSDEVDEKSKPLSLITLRQFSNVVRDVYKTKTATNVLPVLQEHLLKYVQHLTDVFVKNQPDGGMIKRNSVQNIYKFLMCTPESEDDIKNTKYIIFSKFRRVFIHFVNKSAGLSKEEEKADKYKFSTQFINSVRLTVEKHCDNILQLAIDIAIENSKRKTIQKIDIITSIKAFETHIPFSTILEYEPTNLQIFKLEYLQGSTSEDQEDEVKKPERKKRVVKPKNIVNPTRSVKTSVEEPTETSVEEPTETSVEEPTETSVEEPTETSVEEPAKMVKSVRSVKSVKSVKPVKEQKTAPPKKLSAVESDGELDLAEIPE